jgi:DNA mismatch endonuclease, patch repair protein
MAQTRPRYVIAYTMQRVHSKDTTSELVLRRALWHRGLRFRLHRATLPGHPDIVFPGAKVAVFVDGDFWHGNQWRLRGLQRLEDQFRDSENSEYWIRKISRNVIRDRESTTTLEQSGWRVIRVWESDIKRDLSGCVDRVEREVLNRA